MKLTYTQHYDPSTGEVTPTRQCPYNLFNKIGSEECFRCPYNKGLFQDMTVDCGMATKSDARELSTWEQHEQQIDFLTTSINK